MSIKSDINSKVFETPMMQQYMKIKEEYPDCILLFRLGDFYEMFMDDAKLGAEILNITLTARDRGKDGKIPMAGVPYHALDAYLYKLVKAGYKVAIGEQVGEVEEGKKLVEREVVRIVTSGTLLDENSLDKKENNYILGIHVERNRFGIAISDVSTGDFYTAEYNISELENVIINELTKYNPSECILSNNKYNDPSFLKLLKTHKDLNIYPYFEWDFYVNRADDFLKEHFNINSLDSFGIGDKKHAVKASAGLLGYLKYTQKDNVNHIKSISQLMDKGCVGLDRATIMNLELFSTLRDGGRKGSFIKFLDRTVTPMGARLLREWVLKPLIDKKEIVNRYSCVETFAERYDIRNDSMEILSEIGDMERLLSKLSVGIGNPKDIINLKNSLKNSLEIFKKNEGIKELHIKYTEKEINKLIEYIEKNIEEESPLDPKNGNFIKSGNHKELDKLKKVVSGSKEFIAKLEQSEKENTGITSLKVRFNQVFGYYIEITKANLDQVPDTYQRKQTLVNAERFITPELKEHEEIILTAEEKTKTIEYEIFLEVCNEIVETTSAIQKVSKEIAKIDCLINFSNVAISENYIKPKIINTGEIKLVGSRHPVVEKLLDEKEFVPNDVYLNTKEHQLIIITGPNMAGKSVYIRQVALISLLAQIGCFVPCESAEISLVDNIFVRSGASDVITSGLSTFMVEMVETANILNHATDNSLIIMDEIGRGTSTYDGISIAWAISEYLVESKGTNPKTLFATHYHELQKLEGKYPNKIKNYHFSATESNGEPIFLHTVQKGGADHSFGIAVAKIAGVPKEVCKNAESILSTLENGKEKKIGKKKEIKENTKNSELQEILKNINITKTTPLEALNILSKLCQK